MKILLITEFFPTGKDLRFSGGVEARTYFVAKYLAKTHQVHVISTRQPGSKKFEQISNITIHRVNPIIDYNWGAPRILDGFKFLAFIVNSIKIGSRLNPDIVDGGNFTAHLIAKEISARSKIPVIFWYPDVFIGKWIKTAGLINGSAGWILEKFNLIRSADHFIAISKATSTKLVKNRVSNKKISVLHCGVDSNEFNNAVKKNTKFTIICVSRLVGYKRIDDLLKAYLRVVKNGYDVNLVLIGSGTEEIRLKQFCKDQKILRKVKFLKNLSRKDLIIQIKSSHLFCLPSSVEGFGISVIEAAAAGVPYVISDIEVFKEITRNGKGGLFFKLGDIEDLSKKIETLINDENLYREKSQEAKELAKNYQWKDIALDTEKLYKHILNEKN